MSNYVFTWPAGPQDVVLTGEFDHWKGTMPLVKQANGSFELSFPIDTTKKFVFKFIVDGEWTVSDTYKKEADAGGIENNYLNIEDIVAVQSQENRIPESGGLPAATTAGSGAVTPTPTPNAKQQRAPPSTNNRKKGKKGKKMKLKKKIRRNKKTGERTVMSQEVEEVDTSETNTPVEEGDSTTEGTPDSVTPAAVDNDNKEVHILPIDQNKNTTQFQDTSAIAQSGPGPVLASNPNDIPEFRQVREVDADELNERLNKELKQEEEEPKVDEPVTKTEIEEPVTETKVEEPVTESKVDEPVTETKVKEPVVKEPVVEEPVVEEPVVEEPVVEEPVVEEPVVEEPVVEEPVTQTLDPKSTTTPAVEETKQAEKPKEKKKSTKSKSTKDTKKIVPVAVKNSEQQPPKKKGIFGKLKSLFK
ncbi:hypothetical protein C6P45_003362 [Maudiozyma exigua]|uniref:AMP-activated protein kinase glycogen-binding domain-containing protein n=1 Tax=Maudiozyma exigua TaxID=34358 RepID=A0A9P6VTK2_MAUEX|nr:hypothetical protein C6P45_003362 [Kazachstania exigua]